MSRTVATVWHASFSAIAAILYFFFVLPRWWELIGATSHVLGTVLRIVAAVLTGLAALPVAFTLLRTRKPEYRTPQRALTLLVWSIVAHALAGVLIAGTAISEIWLSLDRAGQWLFGSYGAAAAVALLGIGGFYLSFIAELPPPPPKPKKPKNPKKQRWLRRKGKTIGEDSAGSTLPDEPETTEAEESETTDGGTAVVLETDAKAATAAQPTAATELAEPAEPTLTAADATEPELISTGSRRKRRPAGKRRSKNSD